MGEIAFPEKRTYFVARDGEGNVLHVGYTDPESVTTTGQPFLVAGSRLEQIDDLSTFIGQPVAYNLEFDSERRNWIFPEGDHIYIPADPELIENFSRSLYKLIDPERDGLYAGIIWHPAGNEVAWPLLQLRETDEVPIALAADTEPLAEVLQAFVDGGGLTEEEVGQILAAVQFMAGESVKLVDFVPPSWRPFVMSRQQVIDAGYISDELLASG
jgi:hypothetical protein